MIKAVIFDVDGLMFNTELVWINSSKEILKRLFDISLCDSFFYDIIGSNINNIKSKFMKEFPNIFYSEEIFNLYKKEQESYFINFAENLKCTNSNFDFVKPGLVDLLNYLKSHNYKIAIATSSRLRKLKVYLQASNINEDFFDVIITRDYNLLGKPNPDIYIKTISELGILPKDALVLEDSLNGLISAKLAGASTVFIPDCVPLTDEIEKMADFQLESLYDVINLLEKNKKGVKNV